MKRLAWAVLSAASLAACAPDADSTVDAEYDQATGRLRKLALDSDRNGVMDSWSYMDGTRTLRVELDKDEDGRIERWEYYEGEPGAQRLVKVGFSRQNDGVVDAWAYEGQNGDLEKIEISLKRDDTVDRTEYYEAGALVRAEEDTDRDGRIDKWETFRDGAMASVAFDTEKDGKPDRRLIYGPGGALERIER